MNTLLIYPEHPDTFWGFKHALKFISKKALHPPLGLLTVAAMLPGWWEKRLVDLNLAPLDDKDLAWAELVMVSAMAVQRRSARQVIDRCRAAGVKVVAGGPLFTAEPEAFDDVDHLFIGEAEQTMPVFLRDLAKGQPHRVYTAESYPDPRTTPIPLWGLTDMRRYLSMTLQYSRGCPFNCDFCDITALYGHKVRTKDAGQIVTELESLYKLGWRGGVFLVDDNFIGNQRKLKESVLPAMRRWMKSRRYPFTFSTEASINLADDQELMDAMAATGFNNVFIGIETPHEDSLAECGKRQNKNRDLVACVQKIQSSGLQVHGGFIVGFDSDPPSIFQRQVEFIQNSGIVTAMVGLLNAPRGTELYRRLRSQGRLLQGVTGDNTDYSINFTPTMGRDTLLQGYRAVIDGIYSARPYYQRVKSFLRNYQPQRWKPWRFHFGLIRLHFGYAGALFKSMVQLGLRDPERRYYWKLLGWSLFRRPRTLGLAVTYAIYGFHFRRVFGDSLGGPTAAPTN